MMNLVVMALALAGAALLETAWPGAVWAGNARPPLVMCVALYYAVQRSWPLWLAAAVAGGVASDSMNAISLGYSTLCLLGLGLPVRAYRDAVFSGQWLTHMVLGAAGGLGLTLALYVLFWVDGSGVRAGSPGWVALKALGAGAYGFLLAPLVFRLMERMDRMVGNLKVEAAA